jgi:uncharacterized protein (TIGR03118 family)
MSRYLRHAAAPALALLLCAGAAAGQKYTQTNLVTKATDASLVNPWGMSRGSGSPWWLSDNGTGLSTLYTGNGTKLGLTVKIPAANPKKNGTPTGTIYNGSKTDYLIPGGAAAFLFSTLDGLIVGWNATAGPVVTVKTTDGSAYTGLTSANVGGHLWLYAANFSKGRVDVWDSKFHRLTLAETAFDDDTLPPNYVPFNVQAIGDDIVVTYALRLDGNPFETDGPGLGFVDIFTAEGKMVLRLEHGDWLNAPWGVALAPLDFGFYSHDLLIGQFAGGGTTQSSGYIAAYDMATGQFKGLLENKSGTPLAINGIWGISFGNTSPANFDGASAFAPSAEMYFAAGPRGGSGGVFGFVTAEPADLIEGNDQ